VIPREGVERLNPAFLIPTLLKLNSDPERGS